MCVCVCVCLCACVCVCVRASVCACVCLCGSLLGFQGADCSSHRYHIPHRLLLLRQLPESGNSGDAAARLLRLLPRGEMVKSLTISRQSHVYLSHHHNTLMEASYLNLATLPTYSERGIFGNGKANPPRDPSETCLFCTTLL